MWLFFNIIACSIPMVLMYKKIKNRKHRFAEMLFHSGWIVPPITFITVLIYEKFFAEPTGGLALIDREFGFAILIIVFESGLLFVMIFVLLYLAHKDSISDEKNDRS